METWSVWLSEAINLDIWKICIFKDNMDVVKWKDTSEHLPLNE